MLNAAGYTTPSRVHVHGWLTVNGEKMSKTRGTFVLARTYLDHLPADYLRYYFAAKLGSSQEDIDLNFDDFVERVNADLVKKTANLASRCIKFICSRLGGTIGKLPDDAADIIAKARERLAEAPGLYREFESGKALRLAMEIAEDFNLYVTEAAPWKEKDEARAREVCTAGVFASQMIAAIMAPVLPNWAAAVERMLRIPENLDFSTGAIWFPAGWEIGPYENLAERIDKKKTDAIIEASKDTMGAKPQGDGPTSTEQYDYEVPELSDEVGIGSFEPIDLRVGRVAACNKVEGAKKLLQLTIDLGPLGTRNVFSGIARSYEPEQLQGKLVAVFANLAPRKMRFGISEGMVLASGDSDDAVTVLELDPNKARPGDRIT